MPNPTKDRNYLKSRFETNNVPSEQDYADLIDAAVNQTDDGFHKSVGDPLVIDTGINGDPRNRVLQFNRNYQQDPIPEWLLEMDPNGGNANPGLNFLNRDQHSALFLSSEPRPRVGIGTVMPEAGLHIFNDSPPEWRFGMLQGDISLQLGHDNPGGVGSILMKSDLPGEHFFIRPGGNAARMDFSNGQYIFNSDRDVTGGNPGVLQIADGNGNSSVQLHADGDSFIERGNVGLGTANPQARLHVTGGAIMPESGNHPQSGILFPPDPGGGSGDTAWMRYYARSGEATTLEIGVSNDGDDNIALLAPRGVGINHLEPSAALDIQVNNDPKALAIRSNQWNAASKFRINTIGALNDNRLGMTWDGLNYHLMEMRNTGRTYFKDAERQDGYGLRVGAAWGEYGIFAESGSVAVGGVDGVSMQNGQVRVTADGKVGVGTGTPGAQMHIANDSPAAYLYQDVINDVSLELGKDMNGALGSIKLHSYNAGQFNFIRPSNGNFHLDASTGYYYINWDPSVHQGNPGRMILGGRAGDNLLMLNTEGDSFFNGGNVGIGTSIPSAKLHVANDSALDWHYASLVNDISLELGKNGGNGSIGSIKMNSTDQDQFCFIRPSNGNLHVDSTRANYFFNYDASANGGLPGHILVGDGQGEQKISLRTLGSSYFAGGRLGIGTKTPEAQLQVTGGSIMPQPGDHENSGIMFPRDAFGGGGDAAWIRYYARTGEATTFEIGTANDGDDNIALMSPSGVGINHNTPTAALDIQSPNDFALALRRDSWAPNAKWQINTEGGPGSEFLAFSWQNVADRKFVIRSNGRVGIGNYDPQAQLDVAGVTIDGTFGRNLFKDVERHDGQGLRVGAAWGKYGIYAQNGAAVVGGADGVRFQDEHIKVTPDGKMVIGDGSPIGAGKLLVDGRIDVHYGSAPIFNGLYHSATDERAQLVLQSRYSDLVIGSSQINSVHGSTLTFATSDPANPNDYRKFVFNQGNWGARKHMMEIGYDDVNHPNPHTVVAASNVMTLNGLDNKVGIANRDPQHALDVNGEIHTSEPYTMTTAESFTVGGDINKYYPIVFEDHGWSQGVLELEINRHYTHTNSSWRGTIMARIKSHNSNWGHGSEFWELDVVQTRRFIAGVDHVAKAPRVIVWLKGGNTTYQWRSNQKVTLADVDALDTKITFGAGQPNEESVTSIATLPAAYDHSVIRIESRPNGGSFLTGMITMWTGTAAPSGWALCDGTQGTPDLRGRFVIGSGQGNGLSNRPANQQGGAETVALSEAQLPPHTHGVNDPGHFHTWTASRQRAGTDDHNNTSELSTGDAGGQDTIIKNTNSKGTGISLQNTGSGAAHENMPPFYALAYIMKL